MVATLKRKILSQLRRLGLHFEPTMLRVLPATATHSIAGPDAVGKTFAIDLPNDRDFLRQVDSERIENSILKNLRHDTSSSFVEKVCTHQGTSNDEPSRILFQIDYSFFVKHLLTALKQPDLRKLVSHQRHLESSFEVGDYNADSYCKKIIVEYSSPNIAKPFHVGNLRSTIIGQSVANLLEFKGHSVVRMNYLGDWGTQFGVLSLAFDEFGSNEKLEANPLKHLFEVYVRGNKEIETSATWKAAAKERFSSLEFKSDQRIIDQWSHFRDLSIDELRRLYDRLGIDFDVFCSESMYCDSSHDIVNVLRNRGFLQLADDGALLAVVPAHNDTAQMIRVPLIKNDGCTLYLSRDIAAALHRAEQYRADRMYYVVDSSQAKHFAHLKAILGAIGGDPIANEVKHLKFGRIIGMSTRKGDTIFLDEVLDEAKRRALHAIRSSPNTKIATDQFESVADILGVSAIIVNDLANRRVREYRFDWNRALRLNGNTGISLQYTHARLCNLEKNCGTQIDINCDVATYAIDSPEARALINELAMFDQIVEQSYEWLEPSVLANYLFSLKSAINRANQYLTIKGEPEDVAQTRLLLFVCAKNVFGTCMRLLGLRPLTSM